MNYCIFPALITGCEEVFDGEPIKKPIAKCVTKSKGSFVPLQLVISKDYDVRRFQNLGAGDIVFVSGSLLKERAPVVFAREIIMISQNKQGASLPIRKIAFLTLGDFEFVEFLDGDVAAVSPKTTSVLSSEGSFVRGEILSKKIVTINEPPEGVSVGDRVVFVGKLSSEGLEGRISKTEGGSAEQ